MVVPDFNAAEYCTMGTVNGRVKRVVLSEFANVRPSGLIAIGLDAGDELGWVRLTSGKDDIILITTGGYALRFNESTIRPMGRQGLGVTGIKLRKGDAVASMEVVKPGADLLVVTDLGYGKRTPLKDYPVKGRATGGVSTIDQKNLTKIVRITTSRVVRADDDLT